MRTLFIALLSLDFILALASLVIAVTLLRRSKNDKIYLNLDLQIYSCFFGSLLF